MLTNTERVPHLFDAFTSLPFTVFTPLLFGLVLVALTLPSQVIRLGLLDTGLLEPDASFETFSFEIWMDRRRCEEVPSPPSPTKSAICNSLSITHLADLGSKEPADRGATRAA